MLMAENPSTGPMPLADDTPVLQDLPHRHRQPCHRAPPLPAVNDCRPSSPKRPRDPGTPRSRAAPDTLPRDRRHDRRPANVTISDTGYDRKAQTLPTRQQSGRQKATIHGSEKEAPILHGVIKPALLHLQQSAYVIGGERSRSQWAPCAGSGRPSESRSCSPRATVLDTVLWVTARGSLVPRSPGRDKRRVAFAASSEFARRGAAACSSKRTCFKDDAR